jgi:hypothetical protein
MTESEKYVVNIDFPTSKEEGGHKIHLNPFHSGCTCRERILGHYDPRIDKMSEDGGPIYLAVREAIECLESRKQLDWQGRPAQTFRPCGLCRKLPDWDIANRDLRR